MQIFRIFLSIWKMKKKWKMGLNDEILDFERQIPWEAPS